MFSLWDHLAKTALLWKQGEGKPKVELKALAGLACEVVGCFFSVGFGGISGNSRRGRVVSWDVESCVLACAHHTFSSF